jgi:hypothetical protein
VKYHSGRRVSLTPCREPEGGRWLVGSLTGAVASQRVTEAPNGPLRVDGHHPASARAEGGLTARRTGRAGPKGGPSDPTARGGTAVA